VSDGPAGPLRIAFSGELDQLRMQVELMAIRVDENLQRMRDALADGDTAIVAVAFAADDEIDAMNVSLTERCYDLLRREAPMASDLRFIVSVLRILGELERIGDLALRVVKLSNDHHLLTGSPASFEILKSMTDRAIERYRQSLRAWAAMDLAMATGVLAAVHDMDEFFERLMAELFHLEGPEATRIAVSSFYAGRALERINDHAAIIAARLRYLLTGNPEHLNAEVR
jgi:phosphate transport system protein